MSERSKAGVWCAAALAAVVALGVAVPATLPPGAVAAPSSQESQALTWAQASDGSDIQQVGEGDSGDSEGLDDGASPSQEPVADEDIETLDQGAPPTTTTVVDTAAPVDAAPVQMAAAPIDYGVSTSPSSAPASQPAQPTGPTLPPGFGTRQVRVSAGRNGFPLGLEPCHVGAVTGRAYVGIKCGENGDSVVGHAANFQDFPWVVDPGFPFQPGEAVATDPNFPFDEGSPFWLSSEERAGENVVIVSAGGRDVSGDDSEAETDSTSNATPGTVTLAQKAEDRAARRKAKKNTASSEQSSNDSTLDNASSQQRSKNRSKSETVQYQSTAESRKGKAGNGGKHERKHKGKKDKSSKGGKGKQKHKSQNKNKN